MLAQVYFWLFAAVALGCGFSLLIARHPLNGAMALIGTMLSLAGIYSLLAAPFLGVVQVLVYAGAIMMLVIFVIMVLNEARDHGVPRTDRTAMALLVVPAALVSTLLPMLLKFTPVADATASTGTIEAVAAKLFDTSPSGSGLPVLFELTGLILLSAMVAAVVLAKHKVEDAT